MDNEILDAPDRKPETTYADKALKLFFLSFLAYGTTKCLSIYLYRYSSLGDWVSAYNIVTGILGLMIAICSIWGLIYSIKSIINKERNTLKKWIPFFGNLLVSLIIGLVLFANILDILRVLL